MSQKSDEMQKNLTVLILTGCLILLVLSNSNFIQGINGAAINILDLAKDYYSKITGNIVYSPDELILNLSFEETDNTIYSNDKFTGFLINGRRDKGVIGNSIELAGTGYARAYKNYSTNGGYGAFSVAAFVKLKEHSELASVQDSYNVFYRGLWNSNIIQFNLRGGLYNGVFCRVWNGSNYKDVIPFSSKAFIFLDYKWHHIACTRDSNDIGRIYIDGIEVGNLTEFRGNISSSYSVAIGVNYPSNAITADPAFAYFQGKIDEVKFISRQLSLTDVQDEYLTGNLTAIVTPSPACLENWT